MYKESKRNKAYLPTAICNLNFPSLYGVSGGPLINTSQFW